MPNPCDSHYKGRFLEHVWRASVEVQTALNIEIGPWRQLLIFVLDLGILSPCLTFLFFVFFTSLSICMRDSSWCHFSMHGKSLTNPRYTLYMRHPIRHACQRAEISVCHHLPLRFTHTVAMSRVEWWSKWSWWEYVGPHAPWPHVSLIRLPWTFYWFILNKVEKNTWEMRSLRWRENE